ncbi:MAG: TIGR03546 family protein [Candidatus Margulisbacteria bacterium]|nr:TIGR03546 family protein [Candidatus Margulisiibacteriota bacterium]
MVLTTLIVKKILHILRSSSSPHQIAMGFILGAFMGFVPINIIFTPVVGCVLLLFRVNIGGGILGFTICGILSLLLDPIAHPVGLIALTQIPALTPFWTLLYNIPVIPYTHFNNSIVMGQFCIALILSAPMYMGVRIFVVSYRSRVLGTLEKYRAFQMLKASKWVQFILRISE